MKFDLFGLLIPLVATALLFVVPRLRYRLRGIAENGWRKISGGLIVILISGIIQTLLALPVFVNLFVPSVSYWFIVTSQVLVAVGAILMIWGVGNIASSMHQSEAQKSDDEEWRALYLSVQELSHQPFSFVEILNLSLNQILKQASADAAAVLLFKENTEELILAAFSNLSPVITKRLEKIGVGSDVFGRVQKLGRNQNVVNLSDAEQSTAELFKGSEYLSVSVFPLRGADNILGSVALLSTRPFHFHQRRISAISIACNFLASLLESVRSEKEIVRLKDRLRPSEEAKRITEELFFRRGMGGNLELREAVEFERVRKFFDADCIKLVFRDGDGEYRIKASSGGAETGLLLDRRKLSGINRAISERKLLLLTSPRSSAAGKGFDSMPRQTLFVPIPYPDRDDLVLLLESENASLEFSEEKLSAVRVASVYLADLHFLFMAKRDGDGYRHSIQQLDSSLRRVLDSTSVDQITDALGEVSTVILAGQKARIISVAGEAGSPNAAGLETSGLRFPSDLSKGKVQDLVGAIVSTAATESGESAVTKEDLVARLPLEQQNNLTRVMADFPSGLLECVMRIKHAEDSFGTLIFYYGEDVRPARESLELFSRVAEVAALRLRFLVQPQPISEQQRPVRMEVAARSQVVPDAGVSTNGSSLVDYLTWHRIDSNIDQVVLNNESPKTVRAIESLITQFFHGSPDNKLYLSAFSDAQYSYFQVTTNDREMSRFRERSIDVSQWRSSETAFDLPESFRELHGEFSMEGENGNMETVIWRVRKEEKKREKQRKLNILGIDDQEVIRELLSNIIGRMGHKITTVGTGQEGLQLFGSESFDLVIAESGLPDISGWSISEQVKLQSPQTPVIILSGWDNINDIEKAQAGYADFVLTKPFKMEQLGKVIGAACQLIPS